MRFVSLVLLAMACVDVCCLVLLWRTSRRRGFDTEGALGSSTRWLMMAVLLLAIVTFTPTASDALPVVILTTLVGFGALTYSVVRQADVAMQLLDLMQNR